MIYKEFLIRAAKNEDIPLVKNVIYTILAEYGLMPNESGKDSDLSDIEKSYFGRNGFFGVGVEIKSNKLVGTFGLYPISNDVVELRKMYLQRDERGKGLGKFMLDSAVKIAREKRFKKIVLETISPLKIAIAMYKNAGFVEVKPKEINDRVDQAFEMNL